MRKISLLVCLALGLTCTATAKGDAEAGKTKSVTCAACHMADGNSSIDLYPKIAGQHQAYLFKQLKDFKLGSTTGGAEGRVDPVMGAQVAALSEQDMQDLAAYFAEQKASPGSTPEDVIAEGSRLYRGGDLERGITACIACHGPRGDGMGLANFPDISGQHATYIKTQLESFRAGKRANDHNSMMRDIAMRLTDKDIDILAKYLGGLH